MMSLLAHKKLHSKTFMIVDSCPKPSKLERLLMKGEAASKCSCSRGFLTILRIQCSYLCIFISYIRLHGINDIASAFGKGAMLCTQSNKPDFLIVYKCFRLRNAT